MEAKSGKIRFFPLETGKKTFLVKTLKSTGGPRPLLPTPMSGTDFHGLNWQSRFSNKPPVLLIIEF